MVQLQRFMPIATWLPRYRREWLRADLVAGATVWAVLVPSALAYAGIVGVDPMVGLYTVPLALAGYAVFGGSRLLVVGPDAAISVLSAATVAPVLTGDDYLELTLALALICGGVYLLLRMFRMGWIADLIPDPVIKGFIQGLVWVTILDQVPKLLGFSLVDAPDGFWRRSVEVIRTLGDTHTQTAILGLFGLAALFVLKYLVPRIPGPLVVLAGSIVAVGALGLDEDGVSIVGEPTGALFAFGLPSGLAAGQLADLLPGAVAIVVLGFAQSMGAAKSAARRSGETLNPDEELLALGMANLGAGLSGGYLVTGTLSKTSVAVASGGRTQLGNLFAAALAVLTILVLRPIFADLASAVLAAIVVYAMATMIDLAYFRSLWRISRMEFLVAVVAFLGVLTIGVLAGVVVGVVASLALLAHNIGDPPATVLGRAPSGRWQALGRTADLEQIPGMVVWRQEAPLVFLNARRFSNRLSALAVDVADVDVIVVDASATTAVDSTGMAAFVSAADELHTAGIELWIVNPIMRLWAQAQTRPTVMGRDLPPVFDSLDEAVERFGRRARNMDDG